MAKSISGRLAENPKRDGVKMAVNMTKAEETEMCRALNSLVNMITDYICNNYTEFKELDMGFDFYAPQVFTHNGKNIMLHFIIFTILVLKLHHNLLFEHLPKLA